MKGPRQSTRDLRVRQLIAEEAARIMSEEGINDFLAAKRKAANRLGAPDTRNMPRNQEIQAALAAYQQLFRADDQRARLAGLRETALEAMSLCEAFRPRLVGPVLDGTAGVNTPVSLHLFADSPEAVGMLLTDSGIPFEAFDDRIRLRHEEHLLQPGLRFVAGNTVVELTVFPSAGAGNPPLSPVDGRPMERAGRARVEALLHGSEQPDPPA